MIIPRFRGEYLTKTVCIFTVTIANINCLPEITRPLNPLQGLPDHEVPYDLGDEYAIIG
jgi:hypothetical protein